MVGARGRLEVGIEFENSFYVEKALSPEHPYVAASLENYAVLHRETGRGVEAAPLEARAKSIRAKRATENP